MMPEAGRAVLRANHPVPTSTRKGRARRKKVNPRKLARVRREVFERDEFTCRACGLQFNRPADYDGTFAPAQTLGIRLRSGRRKVVYLALDHIYPHILGGPFEPANLQALCSTCNTRKGARLDAVEIGR